MEATLYDKIPDPREDPSEWNYGWRWNIGLCAALLLCIIFWSIVALAFGLIFGGNS